MLLTLYILLVLIGALVGHPAKHKEADPAIFEDAFTNYRFIKDSVHIEFHTQDIGKLKVLSGKLIACDPINLRNSNPFTPVFPRGKFKVQLAIANSQYGERVAFSRILFSNEAVDKWEYALWPGDKKLSIYDSTLLGYTVDAAKGMFIDEQSRIAYNDSSDTEFEKVFITEMNKNQHSGWNYVLYNFGKYNLAAFSTGYGDGIYATYVGYDAKGSICRLLTDFNVVPWWSSK